jgi:hypothetical protein
MVNGSCAVDKRTTVGPIEPDLGQGPDVAPFSDYPGRGKGGGGAKGESGSRITAPSGWLVSGRRLLIVNANSLGSIRPDPPQPRNRANKQKCSRNEKSDDGDDAFAHLRLLLLTGAQPTTSRLTPAGSLNWSGEVLMENWGVITWARWMCVGVCVPCTALRCGATGFCATKTLFLRRREERSRESVSPSAAAHSNSKE